MRACCLCVLLCCLLLVNVICIFVRSRNAEVERNSPLFINNLSLSLSLSLSTARRNVVARRRIQEITFSVIRTTVLSSSFSSFLEIDNNNNNVESSSSGRSRRSALLVGGAPFVLTKAAVKAVLLLSSVVGRPEQEDSYDHHQYHRHHRSHFFSTTTTAKDLEKKAAFDGLKAQIESQIPSEIARLKALKTKYGQEKVGEVTVNMVMGGMRGIVGMLYETSLLDANDGIRFNRGLTIPELQEKLPGKRDREPIPEALLFLLLTNKVPTEGEVEALRVDLMERAEKFAKECAMNDAGNKSKKNVFDALRSARRRRTR